MSCDLLSAERPGPHHQGDVRELLDQEWDLLIARPPCTYLSVSGMHWTTRGLRDPKSAGHGLNLQHGGHHVVFLSLPWSLELYEQTIGRLHRSGQRHDVWCYVFLTDATVDEKIWGSLHDKQSLSTIALESLK